MATIWEGVSFPLVNTILYIGMSLSQENLQKSQNTQLKCIKGLPPNSPTLLSIRTLLQAQSVDLIINQLDVPADVISDSSSYSQVERAPFEDKSSYKRNYQPYEIEPRKHEEAEPYKKRGPKFNGQTTYKNTYKKMELPKQEFYDGDDDSVAQMPREKFKGRSAYKDEYKPWELEKREKFEAQPYRRPKNKMEGKTNYKQNYVPHKIEKPDYQDDESQYQENGPRVPFEGKSAYKNDYVKHKTPSTKQEPYEFKLNKDHGKLGAKRRIREDYPGHKPQKQDFYDSDDISLPEIKQPKFEGRSMYKDSYPGHKPEKREQYVPETRNFSKKRNPSEFNTSYKTNFKAPKIDPNQYRAESVSSYAESKRAKFEGQTSYKDSYVPHKIQKQQPDFEPYQRKQGPKFNGKSTYNQEFTRHPIERQALSEYSDQPAVRETRPKFDGRSHYKAEYQKYELNKVKCPIDRLPQVPAEVKQQGGHVFFDANHVDWHQDK